MRHDRRGTQVSWATWIGWWRVALLVVLCLPAQAADEQPQTANEQPHTTSAKARDTGGGRPVAVPDGVPWAFDARQKIYAIGDIHGNPHALLVILEHLDVIDREGTWIGGDALDLVLLGDLFGRGPDARGVLDVVLDLEGQIEAAGARLHVLHGNHDLMAWRGDHRYVADSPVSWLDIAPFRAQAINQALRDPASPYAQSFLQRNILVKIGSFLFAHAGLDDWINEVTPGQLNATMRRYLRLATQKGDAAAEAAYGWVAHQQTPSAPLWTRRMVKRKYKKKEFRQLLARVDGVDKLIVGHTITKTRRIKTRYRKQLWMIDTEIWSWTTGQRSALEIDPASGTMIRHDGIAQREHHREGFEHPAYGLIINRVEASEPVINWHGSRCAP